MDPRLGSDVAWHDAECGGYSADLEAWRDLAAEAVARDGSAPVVDLGAGTGRVALDLARHGYDVVAVESSSPLAEELRIRVSDRALPVEVLWEDALESTLPAHSQLILAPMQFLQLFDAAGRARLLRRCRDALVAGEGVLAAAILDPAGPLHSGTPDPVPDIRELDGWVHSSMPTDLVVEGDRIEVHRRRQLVSPGGDLSESHDVVALYRLDPDGLAAEAATVGLEVLGIAPVQETDDHVGSVIVSMRAAR